MKAECHEKYKKYRNSLPSLLKESKHVYYTKYFESDWNNIKNTWKEIKTIIPIDKKKSFFIISSLDPHKSSGPNSIPVKILNLLKMTSLNN